MTKIHAKWGFGNAPLKPEHYQKTVNAIGIVVELIADVPDVATTCQLDAISHVKGQFTRVVKQDQWDWCTVWLLLGRPSRAPARAISSGLAVFRCALVAGDRDAAMAAADSLRATAMHAYLDNFLVGEERTLEPGGGHIYILSTRSQPNLLKIGVTERSVEQRVREINSATGVAIPFGIRAVWRVRDAGSVERDIHRLLAEYRVRSDREFFEMDFRLALQLVNDYLNGRRSAS